MAYRIEPLGPQHDRSGFTCGVPPLDRFLHDQAGQEVRRRAAACFVALEAASGRLAGYYTLAAAGLALAELPAALAKRLARYPMVPVARLGRLAVDQQHRGKQLGAALLWDAASRAARSDVAVFALLVDAKDDLAAAFYRHHGFVALGERVLVLPLGRVAGSQAKGRCPLGTPPKAERPLETLNWLGDATPG